MIFHFGHMFIDQGPGGRFDPVTWSMHEFKRVFKTWDDAFLDKGWGSIFLGNHDFARMVSRWGDDKKYWSASAKCLGTLLLSMRGTPFIFQGDEIGMTNIVLTSVGESRDIEMQNGWKEACKTGMSEPEFMKIANNSGRDNARTPVQWDSSMQGGFTEGTPWMKVNSATKSINVASQLTDDESVLNYFKAMIALRKMHHVLIYGKYIPIETENEKLFLYYREWHKEKLIILLNFSTENINLPPGFSRLKGQRLIGNYPESDDGNFLRPWEASIYKL